jgi:hypothetical protein
MREPQAESHWRVSLPMYNLPEMQAANAAFCEAIRRELQRQGIESLPGNLDFARRPSRSSTARCGQRASCNGLIDQIAG